MNFNYELQCPLKECNYVKIYLFAVLDSEVKILYILGKCFINEVQPY